MKNTINKTKFRLIIIITSISLSVFTYGQSENNLRRAISAMETGLFEESLKQLNYALNNDPKNAQVHKLKALLYEALEKKEKAIEAWNDCIRYAIDQSMIQEAKIHLNHLNGI